MNKEILNFCLGKGLLLDKEVLGLFSETADVENVKLIIDKIRMHTHQKIITKDVVVENKGQVEEFLSGLPEEKQKKLEKLKVKLGLSIEITRQDGEVISNGEPIKKIIEIKPHSIERSEEALQENVKIVSRDIAQSKKLEVKDFVSYFKCRLSEMKNILQDHSELNNLVSINKLSSSGSYGRQNVSVIGIVYDKRITKNKNILLEVEDLTGKIKVLVSKDKPELYEKAEEITLDSILGFKGTGNREILFANDVVFPEAILEERKKSPVEEHVLFIGDMHIGSKLFLEENFLKFVDYLNGKVPDTPEVSKIKYLFIIGDVVAGVGVYPGQQKELEIGCLEEQFEKAAELFSKIRGDIKIIVSPGNHDGVRLMEPQPIISDKYAWPLYNLKNVILTTNPCRVDIGVQEGFSGFSVLTYHGFSFFYYSNNISSLIKAKANNAPDKIMKYLLKNRHLAPTHASCQYFPSEDDSHFIKKVPDIFVSGHTHKSSISYYNNVLTVSVSSWENITSHMEKVGAEPDFCKVPMFNLKTRAVKILDFE